MAIPKHPVALAPNVQLDPATMLGQRLLMQGASGAGKSRAMRLMYERLPASYQQIIIDTDDEFHTLRRKGHDYVILGGAYSDAPGLEDMVWRDLAATILKMGANVIFQLNEWGLDQQREFIADLIAGLLSAPQNLWRPLIVGLDETDLYAPNGPTVASSAAIFDLAKRGRKRGFSAFFATQRMASLSADVRGQCENILIGRVNQGLDQRAAAEALGLAPRSAEVLAMKTFRAGEFWIMGPAFGGGEAVRARLDLSETAAPKPGSAVPPSAAPAAVLKALSKLPRKEPPKPPEPSPAATGEAADALKAALISRTVYRTDPGVIEAAQREAKAAGEAAGRLLGLREAWRIIGPHVDQLRTYADMAEPAPVKTVNESGVGASAARTSPPKPVRAATSTPLFPAAGDLSPPSLVVLQAFADSYPRPLTFRQAALMVGRSPKSSNQKTVERELPACGKLTEVTPGRWTFHPTIAAAMGLKDAGAGDPAAVVEKWKAKLPNVPARLLDAIWQQGHFRSREDWAAWAGVSPASSNMKSGPAELVSLDLVTAHDDGGFSLHENLAVSS